MVLQQYSALSHCDLGKWSCNEEMTIEILIYYVGMNTYISGKCVRMSLLDGALRL